jgi:hypothetical protein
MDSLCIGVGVDHPIVSSALRTLDEIPNSSNSETIYITGSETHCLRLPQTPFVTLRTIDYDYLNK